MHRETQKIRNILLEYEKSAIRITSSQSKLPKLTSVSVFLDYRVSYWTGGTRFLALESGLKTANFAGGEANDSCVFLLAKKQTTINKIIQLCQLGVECLLRVGQETKRVLTTAAATTTTHPLRLLLLFLLLLLLLLLEDGFFLRSGHSMNCYCSDR